ncbi:aminotransferase class V-fold PLP-dependent enzyme [Corynebacterium anserum]|uniref:Aminotransferase class V-fold PLP-dependent enzyme n=1 Tax=Corynebacterium anserum TaxID=2684406 RepID=A0A7G7YQJ3_9CORY|nr:aminotransferase class V-fold PLP-dependent enzyme [Corynebacterium anserum]MBC2682454.1 aminotransferase class V-fold PLP-dependent enzyme [Corynebacterium anserum]QNH96763.1 aminotransferase class V-fold PLP-dependent enzyme [Corynebacterium anserum]
MFDNATVRGLYASLSDGWTYVNAQSHPQVPERVSSAVARGFRASPLLEQREMQHGSHSRAQELGRRVGESFVDAARIAIADLVGARPECVILGASRASLINQLATVMGRKLSLGQEIVLSRIDAPANIEPWQRAADLYGARVRWAEPDLASGVLPTWQFAELVTGDTAVVAVAAANEFVGSVTDVRAIADTVHVKSRALLVVDVNAAAPYRVLDIDAMGADVLALDLVGLGGPAVGALIFRDTSLFDATLPRPHYGLSLGVGAETGDDVPPSVARARGMLELGGVSEGLLAGVPAAVDHLASLDDCVPGTRRRRLEQSLPQATNYMNALAQRLVEGLQDLGVVHVVGVDGDLVMGSARFSSLPRIPRVSFLVDNVPASVVEERLLANGVVASVVKPGESMLLERMGVFEEAATGMHARRSYPEMDSMGWGAVGWGDVGRRAARTASTGTGAVAVGLSPHNTTGDMEQILRVMASLR